MIEQQGLFQPLLKLERRPRVSPAGVLVTAWNTIYIDVPLGHTGVLIRGCGALREYVDEGYILNPGHYGIGRHERVVTINTSMKLFDEKYQPETSEGIPTTVGIRMHYNLRPEYAPVFYKTFSSVDFENVLLRPCLESCIDRYIGNMSITNFATREQASIIVGQPLEQLIMQVADGIGMRFVNLHTDFSPPKWQRELAEVSVSRQLNVVMADMQRQIRLLDGIDEAMIARKKHEASAPTEAELELARIQSGAAELREKLNLVQQLLISFLGRQSNPTDARQEPVEHN